MLITTLFNQNLISAPVFGFYLSSNPGASYLDIGILMPDAVSANSKVGIVWLPTSNNSQYWSNYVEGIAIGTDLYKVTKALGQTMTGTASILIPGEYYQRLLPKLLIGGIKYSLDSNGYALIECGAVGFLPKV